MIMMRTASVFSVIGFMLFIWMEPQEHDNSLSSQNMPELAQTEITEADTAPDSSADIQEEKLDKNNQNIASVDFVAFPDDILLSDVSDNKAVEKLDMQELAKPDADKDAEITDKIDINPQALALHTPPQALTPLAAEKGDQVELPSKEIKPAVIEASTVKRKTLPLSVLNPLQPEIPVFDMAGDIEKSLDPMTPEPSHNNQMTFDNDVMPIIDLPMPSSEIKKTVLVADFQSHRMAMQHLDQSDHILDLELFWPKNSAEKEKIAKILRQCFGMTAGYLMPDKTLYHIRNQSVEQANRNLYSQYSRVSQSPADKREAADIKKLKSTLGKGTPLRIFTKIGDSYIIGGLIAAAGTSELNGRITGTYTLEQGRLYLSQINIGGNVIAARIALSDQSAGQCM